MVGRKDVKDFISQEIFAFLRNPCSLHKGFQNIMLLAESGVGKDKVASCITHSYGMAYITVFSDEQMMSMTEFVSPFVGASAGKTRGALFKSIERVLPANEFYDVCVGGTSANGVRDHGIDVINQTVYFCDEFKGLSRFMPIGYIQETIIQFLGSNQGLARRFPDSRRLILLPYSDDELTNVLIRQLMEKEQFEIGPEEARVLHSCVCASKQSFPDLYTTQAGSMFNMATHISRVLASSKDSQWRKGDSLHNCKLLKAAFNDYLWRQRGVVLKNIE